MTAIATLSLAAFDILWEELRLGTRPYPLEVPHHGTTVDERAHLRRAVYADLNGRGLASGERVEPDVEDALRLLASPSVTLEAMALLDAEREDLLRGLVAARGTYAVLAAQEQNAVRLQRVRDTALAASVVDLLPANRPGPGQSVTLPA